MGLRLLPPSTVATRLFACVMFVAGTRSDTSLKTHDTRSASTFEHQLGLYISRWDDVQTDLPRWAACCPLFASRIAWRLPRRRLVRIRIATLVEVGLHWKNLVSSLWLLGSWCLAPFPAFTRGGDRSSPDTTARASDRASGGRDGEDMDGLMEFLESLQAESEKMLDDTEVWEGGRIWRWIE